MAGRAIIVADLLAIHERVEKASRTDRRIRYDNPDRRAPSVVRLQAIEDKLPDMAVIRQAAWVMRALILLQPLPDGNHRTGVLAAELMLEKAGSTWRPDEESGAAFQREVSRLRKELLGGYDDAPLPILTEWDEAIMACCESFIRDALGKRAN